MRPTLRFLLGLALALALCVPSVASAQSTAVPCYGPVTNSVICTYTSSTASTDGSPGTAAAQTIVNATIGTGLMTGQPVKMEVVGYVASRNASPGTWTLTTSWGGNSLTILNALTQTAALVNAPFILECVLVQASSTGGSLAKELDCKVSWVTSGTSAAGTTETSSRQRTTFTFSATPTQAVTVSSTFSNSSTGTGLVVQRTTWSQGN